MSCSACFSGYQHDGEPRGEMIKLNGLDTYVSEPTQGRPVNGIVVIIPDAFGMEFVNNKILADNYAAKSNNKVYLPDFMLGHAAPAWVVDVLRGFLQPGNYLHKPYHIFWTAWGIIPWFWYTRPSVSFPVVKGFFEQLRKDEGATMPIGAAGFCWGGYHTVMLAHPGHEMDGRPLIDAGFAGHPSLLEVPADIEKMVVPVSFAIGEDDHRLKEADRAKIKEIVEGKPEGQKGEVRVYPKCGHGFCSRADPYQLDVAKEAAAAEDQAIKWFNEIFNTGTESRVERG